MIHKPTPAQLTREGMWAQACKYKDGPKGLARRRDVADFPGVSVEVSHTDAQIVIVKSGFH